MNKKTLEFKQFVMQLDAEFATECYLMSIDNSMDSFMCLMGF